MSPSLKSIGRNVALMFGAGGLVFASYEAIGFVVSVDALERFRVENPGVQPPGIEVKNAEFRAFDDERLVTTANVDRMTMSRDRSNVILDGIKDGIYTTEEGKKYNYTAQTAVYQYYRRQLDIGSGGRVWNQEMNITAPAIELNRTTSQVKAAGQFNGKLSKGDVKAQDLSYDLKSGNWKALNVFWKGEANLQESGRGQRTWEMSGDELEKKGDIMIATQGRATDGEVIVKADRIERNVKTDVIVATGNVRYFGIDANITCPKATVYRKEGRALMEGGVNMFLKPEGGTKPEEQEIPPMTVYVPDEIKAGRPLPPSEQKTSNDILRDTNTLRKHPATVIAQRVEYWYRKGSRKANISGNPMARQEIANIGWRMVWANTGTWDGEADLLTLRSREGQKDARLKMSNGDDYKALEFTITTKEAEQDWKGKQAEGVSTIDDEEETTGGGGGTGTTGGTPPPSISGPIGG